MWHFLFHLQIILACKQPSLIISFLPFLSLQSAIQEKCKHYAQHFHKMGQVSLISTMHGESWRRLPTNEPF